MKTILLATALVGCATGAPVSALPVATSFPARRGAPDLPTARALAPRFADRAPLSARLVLCVSPEGDTASVRLDRSSGDRQFDSAIVDDAARWRYVPFAGVGPACEHATVMFP